MSEKIIKYGSDLKNSFVKGVKELANVVKVTLGPCGRCVIIGQSFSSPKVTKDGVTVAKSVFINDEIENVYSALVRDVSVKTNDIVGDGTTTAVILAEAMIIEGYKRVVAGFNPSSLKRGLDISIKKVLSLIDEYSVSAEGKIEQISTISANNDILIGRIVSQAMARIGKHGLVTVEDGSSSDTELVMSEGIKVSSGFMHNKFINNIKYGTCEFERPLILVTDHKISSLKYMIGLLDYANNNNKPLFIICDDIDSSLLSTIVFNVSKGLIKCCIIKTPGFGDNKVEILKDIAIATGSEFLSKDSYNMNEFSQKDVIHLGSCVKIISDKNITTIIDGSGKSNLIQERCKSILQQMELLTLQNKTANKYDVEKLQERYSKMSSGVATIKVGGLTDVEVSERKDRVIDAVSAAKAALDEGILPGGGVVYLRLYNRFDDDVLACLDLNDESQIEGAKILKNSLLYPIKQILSNGGYIYDIVIDKLLNSKDINYGFNALNGEYCDMVECGIVDPTKVCRIALEQSASVASLFLVTDAAIVDKKKTSDNNQEED